MRVICLMAFGTWGLVGLGGPASGSVWSSLSRRAAQVGDDVPISQADELAERLGKSRQVEETLVQRHPLLAERTTDAARKAEWLKLVTRAAPDLETSLLRQLNELDVPAQRAALILAEGGRGVADTIPDLAARAKFLERGGSETVAAIGLHGDDVAHAALRLDTAMQAGRVSGAPGLRPATLADFGQLMVRKGEAGPVFWRRYVTPHWKLWLGGGAMTALLVNPDAFIDAAGQMTDEGFRILGELLGEAVALTIRGTGQVAGTIVQKTTEAAWETFFTGWKGVAATVGVLVALLAVWPRPRRWIVRHWKTSRPG